MVVLWGLSGLFLVSDSKPVGAGRSSVPLASTMDPDNYRNANNNENTFNVHTLLSVAMCGNVTEVVSELTRFCPEGAWLYSR